ncbi:sigma-54-dependent Fis family transcriptional regulator, partial [Halobacillus litoralis]|nr:sigma-54-dependent Fis family transcriptional regulator [Halobacillus litoralis]
GEFREDLFYRLNVMQIRLPPLRDREDDILGLAKRFLEQIGGRMTHRGYTFSPEAMQLIKRYRWPGNVREMENAIERAVILADGEVITPELLDLDAEDEEPAISTGLVGADQPAEPHGREEDAPSDLSLEDYFQHFVLENQDRMSETELAQKLGISRKSLWERRQRLGLS